MGRRPPKVGKREEKVLLIDGDALFKTGYLGAKHEFNRNGEHVGGLYQFITVVRKFLKEEIYHKVFVFWDGEFSGKLRYNLYSDYKSGRNKDYINGTIPEDKELINQRFKVQEYLDELFIRQISDEIVESDDFISYYCKRKEKHQKITIITNDMDLCQLINEDVRVYLCNYSRKEFITHLNFQEKFGYRHENVVLIKTICGDSSDSIKGIKGVKEKSLFNICPELKNEVINLDFVLKRAKDLAKERLENKMKPLQILDNIINSVTEGVQGEDIYKINEKIVNLTTPLLTEEALIDVENLITGVINPEDRGIKNVYTLVKRDSLDDLIKDDYFTEYFLPFKRLMEREKKELI